MKPIPPPTARRLTAAAPALLLLLLPSAVVSASPAESFAAPIEAAHGLDAWRAQDAVEADITVRFGGQVAFAGEMLFAPDMSAVRLTLADGTLLIYDGEEAWVSPAAAEVPRARFHLLTWPYFLAAPMKLRDPGTHLELLGELELDGRPHPAARLTFGEGVGDTPEDWYILYRDPETDRLAAMAYIVTYGTSLEEASAEPHAITYDGFVDVEGVAVPTRWGFRHWSEEEGIHGDPLGSATLENVKFVTPLLGAFVAPPDARSAPLPGAGSGE